MENKKNLYVSVGSPEMIKGEFILVGFATKPFAKDGKNLFYSEIELSNGIKSFMVKAPNDIADLGGASLNQPYNFGFNIDRKQIKVVRVTEV